MWTLGSNNVRLILTLSPIAKYSSFDMYELKDTPASNCGNLFCGSFYEYLKVATEFLLTEIVEERQFTIGFVFFSDVGGFSDVGFYNFNFRLINLSRSIPALIYYTSILSPLKMSRPSEPL